MKKCDKCWDELDFIWTIDNPFYICTYCHVKEDVQDMVNHPNHYTRWNIEVIDFILDQKLWYLESNIVKYICRYKYKNWVEDLLKAEWYLQKLIKSFDKMK